MTTDLTGPQIAAKFVKDMFGDVTKSNVHFCSFGNERDGKHLPRSLNTRDAGELCNFITKWDQEERGLFFAVSTIKDPNKKRGKDNVAEISMLHADIDQKDVDDTQADVERKLKTLRHPPSMVVSSGHGSHAYWLLTESIVDPDVESFEALLKQLSDVVGGDLQVCEIARVMRLPGSHNTKNGEMKRVEIVHAPVDAEGRLIRYEMSDIEEWLGEQSPIILRKERPPARTVKQAIDDPYLEHAIRNGFKPPINVRARLEAMMYMGGGDASVHKTQIDVASSMLAKGHNEEEIVQLLMAATQAAAGDYGKRWNWRTEEKNIRLDIAGLPEKFEKKDAARKTMSDEEPKTATVTQLRPLTQTKPKPAQQLDASTPNHIHLGDAVIKTIKSRGDDLMFTERASWFCDQGIWQPTTDINWLNVEIQKGAVGMDLVSINKLINETRSWITRQPELWRNHDDVPWNKHGLIPTTTGLIDPRTLQARPIRPDDYCTWRIDIEYDPMAECPAWLQVLSDTFSDRDDEEKDGIIMVIQESLGVGLLDDKPKALSRALIFQGKSNSGKSNLIEVMAGLFGHDVNTADFKSLESAHGLSAFLKRRPWILHEAFDQRTWHFSSAVKAVISGEPVQGNVKYGPLLSLRVTAPAFWGTNHPPTFKESTKAIVNRLLIIKCNREFLEWQPVGVALKAKAQGLNRPSDLVLKDEKPGVLAWAIQGCRRALERGHFLPTASMKAELEQVYLDGNLVAGFLAECIHYDEGKRISIPDFCLAFGAWWLENKGENRGVPTNEQIGRNLAAMGDLCIAVDPKQLRDMHRRYYAGIVLNDAGLHYHRAGLDNPNLRDKRASTTEVTETVNQTMTPDWLEKPCVKAMIASQRSPSGDGNEVRF